MTIDLGFGWLTLPDGEEVGIVDVPGHRDFIENMLAGVGGIDAALLVIAADEGVMPQTREHLAILDLLQIPAGVIVVTKTDLITDRDWLDALEADIRSAVKGTCAAGCSHRASLCPDPQRAAASWYRPSHEILRERPPRPDLGRPRLPDRPRLHDERIRHRGHRHADRWSPAVGEEVQVLPSGLAGRVRGLQTHKKKEERAAPGSRTAVNISGISTEQIRRGDVLTRPGQYPVTRRVDARFRLLPDVSASPT